MMRARAALILLVRFAWQVVVSGASTAWIIVRPHVRPRPGFVRMPFGNLSPTGAALLGGMVTLTPGTTTIDVDLERRQLLIHLLDSRDPSRVVARIRRQFERYLEVLHPEARP